MANRSVVDTSMSTNTRFRANPKATELQQSLLQPSNQEIDCGRGVENVIRDGRIQPKSRNAVLDGFMLLDVCSVEFPEEATRANVSGMNIMDVASEDLQYFSSLLSLDISDNEAPFEPLQHLPSILELQFQCNALHKMEGIEGFPRLEVLDISYNCLKADCFQELMKIPRLRELYISSNCIRSIPLNMERFLKLESLSLERNNLKGDYVLVLLSTIPRLKRLNISHNRIERIPEIAVVSKHTVKLRFFHLEYLNLAYNDIKTEEDVMGASVLSKLNHLVLYGNPLAHSAVLPQDCTRVAFDPVPSLTWKENGEKNESLEVYISYPDQKKRKSNHAMYDNFKITRVRNKILPTNQEFRARGNRLLFSQAAQSIVQSAPKSEKRGFQDEEGKTSSKKGSPTKKKRTSEDSTFLTGVGIEEEQEDEEETQEEINIFKGLECDSSTYHDINSSVFAPSLTRAPARTNSKLRAAMSALRYHLDHPLTSHDMPPGLSEGVDRPTSLHAIRTQARRNRDSRISRFDRDVSLARSKFALSGVNEALDQMNLSLSHPKRPRMPHASSKDVESSLQSLGNTAARMDNTFKDKY